MNQSSIEAIMNSAADVNPVPEGKPASLQGLTDKEIVTYLCQIGSRGATVTFKPCSGKTEVTIEDEHVSVKFGALVGHRNLTAAVLAHKAASESMKASAK